MSGNKGNADKEPQELQGASDSDAPQGSNSKKVNYNLSNRRQLVGLSNARHLANHRD